MENTVEERDVIFRYTKDGKELHTPCQVLAHNRADANTTVYELKL